MIWQVKVWSTHMCINTADTKWPEKRNGNSHNDKITRTVRSMYYFRHFSLLGTGPVDQCSSAHDERDGRGVKRDF